MQKYWTQNCNLCKGLVCIASSQRKLLNCKQGYSVANINMFTILVPFNLPDEYIFHKDIGKQLECYWRKRKINKKKETRICFISESISEQIGGIILYFCYKNFIFNWLVIIFFSWRDLALTKLSSYPFQIIIIESIETGLLHLYDF